MSAANTTSTIVTAALEALPSVLGAIMAHHAAANPDAPPLTEMQAIEILQQAIAQSLARDAQLRAPHDSGNDVAGNQITGP